MPSANDKMVAAKKRGLRHHPTRLLVRCAQHCASPPCAPATRSTSFEPAAVRLDGLPTRAGCCLVAAVRRCKGGDGRGERGWCERLFEVTEIARTDDKMLMDEMLNNTA